MKKVFIVLRGVDCEGAYVCAVFEKKEDAVKYLDEEFARWKKVDETERRSSPDSAFIEEWDVE